MLGDELGTASNIKSRVNRQSVLGAITSAQQRLKLYNKVHRPSLNTLRQHALCFQNKVWNIQGVEDDNGVPYQFPACCQWQKIKWR